MLRPTARTGHLAPVSLEPGWQGTAAVAVLHHSRYRIHLSAGEQTELCLTHLQLEWRQRQPPDLVEDSVQHFHLIMWYKWFPPLNNSEQGTLFLVVGSSFFRLHLYWLHLLRAMMTVISEWIQRVSLRTMNSTILGESKRNFSSFNTSTAFCTKVI